MASSNAYAHGHSEGTIKAHAQRNVDTCAGFIVPYLTDGISVLDLGCGPGSITADFASRVGNGRVVGIDRGEAAIQVARDTHTHANLEFVVGDITDLPFENETFDIVYAHQVFVHLSAETQEHALREARRVCKSGGMIALREAQIDNDTLMYPIDTSITKLIDVIRHRAVSSGAYAQSASHLPEIAEKIGYTAQNIERKILLDAHDTAEARAAFAESWIVRASEKPLMQYAMDNSLMDEAELASVPERLKRWRDTPYAWLAIVQLEMTFRK